MNNFNQFLPIWADLSQFKPISTIFGVFLEDLKWGISSWYFGRLSIWKLNDFDQFELIRANFNHFWLEGGRIGDVIGALSNLIGGRCLTWATLWRHYYSNNQLNNLKLIIIHGLIFAPPLVEISRHLKHIYYFIWIFKRPTQWFYNTLWRHYYSIIMSKISIKD